MSACTRGAPDRSAASIPWLRSTEIGSVAGTCEVDAQVAGAARQVEDTAAGRQFERAHGPPAPPHVEAERHDAVDEVVPRRDGVEHVAHGADLVVALGQRFAIPRCRLRSGSHDREARARRRQPCRTT